MRNQSLAFLITVSLMLWSLPLAAQDLGLEAEASADVGVEGSAGAEGEVSAEGDLGGDDTLGADPLTSEPAAAAAPVDTGAGGEDWANKEGVFGIGLQGTLGGTVGLHGRYFVTEAIGLHVTASLGIGNLTIEPPGGGMGTDFSTTTIGIGAGGSYKLHGWNDGHMSLVAGIDISSTSASSETAGFTMDGSDFGFGFSVGFMGEFFLSDYFSVFGQAGLRLGLVSGDLTGGDSSSFSLGTTSDGLAAFGLTAWFI